MNTQNNSAVAQNNDDVADGYDIKITLADGRVVSDVADTRHAAEVRAHEIIDGGGVDSVDLQITPFNNMVQLSVWDDDMQLSDVECATLRGAVEAASSIQADITDVRGDVVWQGGVVSVDMLREVISTLQAVQDNMQELEGKETPHDIVEAAQGIARDTGKRVAHALALLPIVKPAGCKD